MKPLKVHVLYEYGVNMRPHASASLRLIRPLTYPAIQDQLAVTFGYELGAELPDLVLADRLWKPGIQPEMVHQLADEVHQRGAKLIYWFDDNFSTLPEERGIPAESLAAFRAFLDESQGLVVSTAELQAAFAEKARTIFLPSALDERLIVQKEPARADSGSITIGYMGTSTHDDDLRMVLPALQEASRRYPGRLRFQFVGVMNQGKLDSWEEVKRLPVEILQPLPWESEYPLFMLWFTGETRWDIGIAPLVDTPFNRFKSDIKFLDYTAAGVPGIFSAVAPYAQTVVHGSTGLVVENTPAAWSSALNTMIEDAALRASLLKNARDYLYQNRVLARCADNWRKTLYELME